MRVIPPYPDYKFFRNGTRHFCSSTLCDLSILVYSEFGFVCTRKTPFDMLDWIDYGETQVLVVKDRSEDEVAIVFRGTSTFCVKDWNTNLNVGLDVSGVHSGFHKAFLLARPRLEKFWAGRRLFLTGHSLGGALATVAAWYFRGSDLVTFGSPRVGDSAFAKAVHDGCGSYCERYVHGHDVVPTLPMKSLGYEHVGNEIALRQCPRPWSNILVPRPVFDHVPTLYAERIWA